MYRLILLLLLFFSACVANMPDAPEATVDFLSQALLEKRPEVLWQAMPPSYQEDVVSVFQELGDQVGPETWGQIFGLFDKAGQVMQQKKDFLRGVPDIDRYMRKLENPDEEWEKTASMVRMIGQSQFVEPSRIGPGDIELFLTQGGAELMDLMDSLSVLVPGDPSERDWREQLRSAKATLVSIDGDQAVVKIDRGDQDLGEVKFSRVEGRWIPEEMARTWETQIADTKAQIRRVFGGGSPEKGSDSDQGSPAGIEGTASGSEEARRSNQIEPIDREALESTLALLHGSLDNLLAAETRRDFYRAWNGFAGVFLYQVMRRG